MCDYEAIQLVLPLPRMPSWVCEVGSNIGRRLHGIGHDAVVGGFVNRIRCCCGAGVDRRRCSPMNPSQTSIQGQMSLWDTYPVSHLGIMAATAAVVKRSISKRMAAGKMNAQRGNDQQI